jgi:DedD protein
MTEERSGGVWLSEKHIVFGLMTATVVAVVVFLCGVFVGRGVPELRPDGTEVAGDNRVVPDPGTSAAEGETAGGSVADASGAVAAPPEKLTYTERLTKTELPAESLKGPVESGPPVPPPEAPDAVASEPLPAAGVGVATTSAATPPVPVGANGSAVPAAASKAPAVQAKPGQAAPKPAAAGLDDAGSGPFTIQVSAVKHRADADQIVNRLKKSGFPAFVFVPPPGDPRGGFRVRVGTFTSREQAAAMASRLQKEKYQPWITR